MVKLKERAKIRSVCEWAFQYSTFQKMTKYLTVNEDEPENLEYSILLNLLTRVNRLLVMGGTSGVHLSSVKFSKSMSNLNGA